MGTLTKSNLEEGEVPPPWTTRHLRNALEPLVWEATARVCCPQGVVVGKAPHEYTDAKILVRSLEVTLEERAPPPSWYSPWIVWLRKMLCIGALGHKGYLEKQLRARKRRRNHK